MKKYYHKLIRNYVRRTWEKEGGSRLYDPEKKLANLHRMVPPDAPFIDDQTWEDLGIAGEFAKMNKTFSNAGEQMLYNMLRVLLFDEEELKRRDRMIRLLQNDGALREKLQCLLYYMGKHNFDSVGECLYGEIAKPPHGMALLLPATLGMLFSVLSIPFLGLKAVLPIFAFAMINMTIHYLFIKDTDRAMPGIRGVARLLELADEISRFPNPELKGRYTDFFADMVGKCRMILRKVRFYGAGVAADPFGISAILQILFLAEERTYVGCAQDIAEYRDELREIYERLGELDALQSMAFYRGTLRPVCTPEFIPKKSCLCAVQIGHPAIKNAVCNDISLDQKNLVLTGSNMSGKSTFLRTIGFNAVLAQTFYMAKAEKYQSSMFRIATSISPSDSLAEGRSYYMAEAQALLRMLPLCEGEYSALLLIDEIFRGTNPAERVAAASSLLTYLSKRNCLVGVATHDIEITKQVQELYESYHFEEIVSKNTLKFDYILREGVLKKPNGIHILEYLGFPEEITDAALDAVRGVLPE